MSSTVSLKLASLRSLLNTPHRRCRAGPEARPSRPECGPGSARSSAGSSGGAPRVCGAPAPCVRCAGS
eukprot:7852399-Pyramimonas_sp.AAC.2